MDTGPGQLGRAPLDMGAGYAPPPLEVGQVPQSIRALLAGRWCAVGMHVVPENVPECVNSRDLCHGWGRGGTGKSGLDGMQCMEEFVFKCETG